MTHAIVYPALLADLNSQSSLMNTNVQRIVWLQRRGTITTSEATSPYLTSQFDLARYNTPTVNDIVFWGDSLTRNSNFPFGTMPLEISSLIADMHSDLWCVNMGGPGQNSTQIMARITADNGRHMGAIQVFWLGRNDASSNWDTTGAATVKANIAAAVAAMTSTPKRYLVLSVLNGNYAVEYSGQTRHTNLIAMNDDLATIYPDNYLDIRQVLIDAADPVIDATDITRDIPPGTLRNDDIHLNAAGLIVAANSINAWLVGKGWL